MNVSCSKKGVFLPVESAYTEKVRAILATEHYFHDTNYPIKLTDKSPFQKAYYRDCRELNSIMGTMTLTFLSKSMISKTTNENIEKEYFIISCDDEYIYIGVLKENNTELYTKYNPITKEDMYSAIKTRSYRKYYYWIIQEMNKGSIISINGTKRTFIAKSFNSTI
jgi:hypothetical protein